MRTGAEASDEVSRESKVTLWCHLMISAIEITTAVNATVAHNSLSVLVKSLET